MSELSILSVNKCLCIHCKQAICNGKHRFHLQGRTCAQCAPYVYPPEAVRNYKGCDCWQCKTKRKEQQ